MNKSHIILTLKIHTTPENTFNIVNKTLKSLLLHQSLPFCQELFYLIKDYMVGKFAGEKVSGGGVVVGKIKMILAWFLKKWDGFEILKGGLGVVTKRRMEVAEGERILKFGVEAGNCFR